MNKIRNHSTRQLAVEIVSRFMQDQAFPDRELERIHHNRAQVMQIVYGVLRHLEVLRWIVGEVCSRPPRIRVEACLFCGLYQLLYMDNIEEFAVVHEMVEIGKRITSEQDARLVNAVLRRLIREKAEFMSAIEALPLHTRLSHPQALFNSWTSAYGTPRTEDLCRWNNNPAFTTIRLRSNTGIALADYMQRLVDQNINASPHPYAPEEFIVIPHGTTVAQLPGYREGYFTVQDPATAVSVNLLDPKPGMTVLDACAAPGGKTMLLAERMSNQGELVAIDLYEDRLVRLRDNLKRMAHKNVHIFQGDASRIEEIPATKVYAPTGFDAILIDVPCSNTGVIRRRPDARYRYSKTRLKKLLKAQVTILYSASKNVRKGGRIVYSTCSLEAEENQDQIRRWLSNNPSFILEKEITLFPPETKTDGAYAAVIRRT